jgi:AcrR family transcriptional regulator
MPRSAGTPARTRLAPDERRAQIVAAARGLFAARPFHDVSIADIARAAGVTRGLVHHYFGGVRDVYLAVLGEIAEAGVIVPGGDPELPREERVARSADSWLDIVERNREAWLATAAQGDAIADPEIRELIEAGREAAVERMLRANADTVADTPEARVVLRSLLGLNQAACRQWLAGRATRAETHALLTTAFLALIDDVIPAVEAVGGA